MMNKAPKTKYIGTVGLVYGKSVISIVKAFSAAVFVAYPPELKEKALTKTAQISMAADKIL